MTTAGGQGPGGGGMSYGDDYIAARLSIDIPEGSVEGIREITQEIDRFRISVEAATRVEADMTRYLEQMNEATKASNEALREAVQILSSYMSLTDRTGSGTPGGPSGVPGGPAQQPFANQAPGSGAVGSQPSRPSSPSDVPQVLARAAQTDPAGIVNMQHARGGLSAQDVINLSPQSISQLANKIVEANQRSRTEQLQTQEAAQEQSTAPGYQTGRDPTPLAERVRQAATLGGRVANEMQAGRGVMGLGGLAVQGLQYAARRSAQIPGRQDGTASAPTSTEPAGITDAEQGGAGAGLGSAATSVAGNAAVSQIPAGGGAGGIMGLLSKIPNAALWPAAILGVFEAIQIGGQMIQSLRNTASVRGGAAGEGAQVEAKARIMSMNPFITQDQARQIYQSVMSEGYADASGSGADNVIDFMKSNLTNMNISVADSAKMLRSTIVGDKEGDKESVAGALGMLRSELDTIRALSKESVISTPDYQKAVMGLQDQLVAQGASPAAAAGQATLAEEVGSQDQAFKGQFSSTLGEIAANPAAGGMLRMFGGANVPAGLIPSQTVGYLAQHGQLDQAVWNTLRTRAQVFARMDRGDEVSRRNAVARFQKTVQGLAPGSDAAKNYAVAEKLYLELLGNQEFGAASQRVGEQPEIAGANQESVTPLPEASFEPNTPVSPSAGGGGGGGGSSSGGGGGYAGGGGGGAHVTGSASVEIGLTPEAQRLLSVSGGPQVSVELSANEKASNRGIGGAARNNPQVK